MMNFADAALLLVLLLGVFAGTIVVVRSPKFWFGIAFEIVKSAAPYLTKRMPPDLETQWRDCQKRGGTWDHIRKRCKS